MAFRQCLEYASFRYREITGESRGPSHGDYPGDYWDNATNRRKGSLRQVLLFGSIMRILIADMLFISNAMTMPPGNILFSRQIGITMEKLEINYGSKRYKRNVYRKSLERNCLLIKNSPRHMVLRSGISPPYLSF